nr:hypothetical protein [Tanacetum cinerariifolium]
MDTAHWPQEIPIKPMDEIIAQNVTNSCSKPSSNSPSLERRLARPQKEWKVKPHLSLFAASFSHGYGSLATGPLKFCGPVRSSTSHTFKDGPGPGLSYGVFFGLSYRL